MWMFCLTEKDLFKDHDPLAHWPPRQVYQRDNCAVQESPTTKCSKQTANTLLDCLKYFLFQKMLLKLFKLAFCFLITTSLPCFLFLGEFNLPPAAALFDNNTDKDHLEAEEITLSAIV